MSKAEASVEELVGMIERGELRLPEMQRRYVWGKTRVRDLLDSLYRVDSGRILATLIRLLGDFDLAEEAMHEAFAAGLSLWPSGGVPGNPRPWLISTARFKAIDTLGRRARVDMRRLWR